MARLKLKSGESYKTLGHLLVAMAKAAYPLRPEMPYRPDEAYALEHRFHGLFDETFVPVPPALKQMAATEVEDGVLALFHFDRTIEEDGKVMRIVNIAIPDFQGKVTSRVESGNIFTVGADAKNFDLTDVAAEAFGFVVILGCVG